MSEFFLSGHTACAGCNPALALRKITEVLGKDTVVVISTGCMEVVSTQYPNSQWNLPVIHSLFENAPAVASGISRAFKKKGIKASVLCIQGDGAGYDIGFGALSGAMERNEDFIAVIYDNESYSNTGIQRSGATPFKAFTKTTPLETGGKTEWKKNIAFIAAAHGVPYVATAAVSFLKDLENKVSKAKALNGFKLIVVQAPCPPAWGINSSETIAVSKLGVETGLWNLFEIENGVFKFTLKPELKPVADYLKKQSRFKHLNEEDIKLIQEHVNKVRLELELLEQNQISFRHFL